MRDTYGKWSYRGVASPSPTPSFIAEYEEQPIPEPRQLLREPIPGTPLLSMPSSPVSGSRSPCRLLPAPSSPLSLGPTLVSDKYNFDDWNVAFEVENTTYRVHKFFFKRESPFFAKEFDVCVEGQPIPLSNVTRAEFDALLEFMYTASFEPDTMTLEKWISVLHLSNMWEMTRIKNEALKKIYVSEELSTVDGVVVAANKDIKEWCLSALTSLVERPTPLSVEESRKLYFLGDTKVGSVTGMDVVPLLAQARERVRNPFHKRHLGMGEEVVRKLFGFSRNLVISPRRIEDNHN